MYTVIITCGLESFCNYNMTRYNLILVFYCPVTKWVTLQLSFKCFKICVMKFGAELKVIYEYINMVGVNMDCYKHVYIHYKL